MAFHGLYPEWILLQINQSLDEMGGKEADRDPAYTALCSRLTLYSDREGFFKELASAVMTEVAEKTAAASALGIGRAFSSLQHDQERVRYVAALDNVSSLEPPALYRSKSAKEARIRREEGNAALKKGDLKKAMLLYSASVMRAPGKGQDASEDDGLSLAYAFANRSAVLLQMNSLDFASRDASLALSNGYPPSKKHVLLERMGRIEEARGRPAEAMAAYEEALKTLGKKDKELEKTIKAAMEKCGKAKGKKKEKKTDELPHLTGGANELLPNAAKAVGIAESSEGQTGRYAVAMEDISAGDILVSEPPFASILSPEKAGTHCHHCFTRLFAPVPCESCSGVAFCDVDCRDAASSSYHSIECPISSTLIASGLSLLSRLALRLLTSQPLANQIEALDQYAADGLGPDKLWTKSIEDSSHTINGNVEEDVKEKRYYDVRDYRAVLNLVSLSDQRSPIDMLERTLMAVFLIKCLRHTSFFKPSQGDLEGNIGLRSEEEVYAGRLLLHHLQTLQFNAHEIFETVYERKYRLKGCRTSYVGVGVYPTVSLFNHDCYPATTRYFVGKQMVLQALRPLKAGEPIPENYGPVFTKHTLRERQRSLRSRYWFICGCRACTNDWPNYDGMQETVVLKCPKEECGGTIAVEPEALEEREQLIIGQNKEEGKEKKRKWKCGVCGTSAVNQLDRVIRLKGTHQEALSAMEKEEGNQVDKAVRLLCKCIQGWSECLVPPHRQLLLAQDSLRTCVTSRGNSHVADPANAAT